jgi:hypothetical protein
MAGKTVEKCFWFSPARMVVVSVPLRGHVRGQNALSLVVIVSVQLWHNSSYLFAFILKIYQLFA